MATDSNEVDRSADEDEAVPYGVGERYDTVTLKEHDANDVDGSASCQLVQSGHLFLHSTASIAITIA